MYFIQAYISLRRIDHGICNTQTVLRRRDNIQAEFEAKNEALAAKKTDSEAVSAILTLSFFLLIRPMLSCNFWKIISNKALLQQPCLLSFESNPF